MRYFLVAVIYCPFFETAAVTFVNSCTVCLSFNSRLKVFTPLALIQTVMIIINYYCVGIDRQDQCSQVKQ